MLRQVRLHTEAKVNAAIHCPRAAGQVPCEQLRSYLEFGELRTMGGLGARLNSE
jgi:hypothetical protein